MGKRRARTLEQLTAARDGADLVRIERRDADDLEGYVVAVGREWVLLALLEYTIVLEEHAAVRISDVRQVRRRSRGDMVRRALELRQQWPPAAPEHQMELDDLRSLLTSLVDEPLVTIYPEHDETDTSFVGAPVGVGTRSLRLLEVSPRGVWGSKPTKHRLDTITRVEFGGRHEQALLSVAGLRPPQRRISR